MEAGALLQADPRYPMMHYPESHGRNHGTVWTGFSMATGPRSACHHLGGCRDARSSPRTTLVSDRLLVDFDPDGRVSVDTWLDNELPGGPPA